MENVSFVVRCPTNLVNLYLIDSMWKKSSVAHFVVSSSYLLVFIFILIFATVCLSFCHFTLHLIFLPKSIQNRSLWFDCFQRENHFLIWFTFWSYSNHFIFSKPSNLFWFLHFDDFFFHLLVNKMRFDEFCIFLILIVLRLFRRYPENAPKSSS